MKAIIINADDYAFSPEITAGICYGYRRGVITDTSILVRSPYAPEAIARAADVGLPMGLHLDLVSPFVQDRSPFFGPQGRVCLELFTREFDGRGAQLFTGEELIAMRDEMRSQVDVFTKLARRPPSHLDYHYGLHHMPEVMAIYLIVAEEGALPVRWGSQYAGHNPYRLAPAFLCDRFRGLEAGGVELFLSLVDEPWEGVQEIVCHPGYTTPAELPDAYNASRELELRTLTDPRLKEGLQERGIQPVNYDWLRNYLLTDETI
jgi:predicted glycoside hydrolase/deacetylase ChbG (UPF0249 family)